MRSVFLQALVDHRTGTLLVALALFGTSLLMVYIFDAFGGLEVFQEFVDLLPESMQALLRATGGLGASAEAYLGAQYRHPMYLVATAGFAIGTAAGMVARDVERGSLLMVLSTPMARWRYLAGKYGAFVFGAVSILAAAWLGTWVGVQITGVDSIGSLVFVRVIVSLLALTLAVGGIATLLSAWLSDGGQVTGIATGVVVGMFFLDFLAALWDPAAPFGPLSLFYYYDPQQVSLTGFPERDLGVLFGVAAATFGLALVVFQRRDIAR